MGKVLWDSGAIDGSYISKEWVDARRSMLMPYLRRVQGMVRMGDNKTLVPILEILRIDVSFMRAKSSEWIRGRIDFAVMPMNGGLDGIIGLPDILRGFLSVFIDLLETAGPCSSTRPTLYMLSLEEIKEKYPDTIDSWNGPCDEMAPEELELEDMHTFERPLYYLSKPHDEVVEDYMQQFDTHISPEWKANPKVVELLTSQMALEVFCPKEWRHILGIDLLEIEFSEDMPKVLRPKIRPLNPIVKQQAEKEYRRMCTYMYEDSDSSIASPLVIAPKSTAPFVRLCGDYRVCNQYIKPNNYYIPHIMKTLEKAAGFKYFIDADLKSAFHQIKLGENTSRILSIVSPFGCVKPKYLPEGVTIGSHKLQAAVMSVFHDMEDFVVAIFDNILICCHSVEDGINKLERVIRRCHERHVILSFSKTWVGFDTVKFFGYKVTSGSYGLDVERKSAVMNMTMPANTKAMQRFLGTVLFFNEFVPNYAEATKHLYDMIKVGFSWDTSTWSIDYKAEFEKVKNYIADSVDKHFPDYEKDWFLYVDASEFSCGAALLQLHKTEDGKEIYQPIGFKSHKFSGPASRWDIHKKEAYSVYMGFKAFEYYLKCKPVIIFTDHANLEYIQMSQSMIVTRWRIYLQSFQHVIRKIKGKQNVIADFLSRLNTILPNSTDDNSDLLNERFCIPTLPRHDIDDSDLDMTSALSSARHENGIDQLTSRDGAGSTFQRELVPFPPWCQECVEPRLPEFYIQMVHNTTMTHQGARKTWQLLGKYFPGHRIPFSRVASFVRDCPRCQKDARRMVQDIRPLVRTVIPPENRFRVGIDLCSVSPVDDDGHKVIIAVVNLRTKHCSLFAAKDYKAQTVASALMRYICTFGLVDEVVTDPGSHFMNEVIALVNSWLGIRHIVSLVDVHESNGVEPTNRESMQHLRALVNDKRMRKQWSRAENLGLVEFALNDRIHSETGCSAFELTFGTREAKYFALPDVQDSSVISHEWLRQLNDNLRVVREVSATFQRNLIAERTRSNPPSHRQRQYAPGDLVLHNDIHDGKWRVPKLNSRCSGPYEVIGQSKNDVECRHLCMKNVVFLRVDRLALYSGSRADAERLAKEDADQFSIALIHAYRGNPAKRNSMEFDITFEDGDRHWKPFDRDLFNSLPYEDFCRAHSELFDLLVDTDHIGKEHERINSQPITEIEPGQTVYVNIRYFGFDEYDARVNLPDKFHTVYVIPFVYKKWAGTHHLSLDGYFPLLGNRLLYNVNHLFVHSWGHTRVLEPHMIVITDEHVIQFPRLVDFFIGPSGPHRNNLRKRLKLT